MKTHPNKNCRRRSGCPTTSARFAAALLPVVLAAALGAAGTPTPKSDLNLGDLSLEQLMNESVTSVSKKEEMLTDAAAAVFVLTNDDLRRSGATSVAEALRLVPGLDVGQINASQWAVSSRGALRYDNIYSDKLLVMVDGRTVYTPLFAGVYWDLQQSMLEDVDRIEVIRGPGGTIWGANAVNGVISVQSKSARDTQGSLLYGGGGDVHLTMAGARYGGQIDPNTYSRVFGSYAMSEDYQQASGLSAADGWQSGSGGFRVDSYPSPDTHLTWQGDATETELDDHVSDAYNVNTLARWTREFSGRSSAELQAYYDRTYRNETTRSRNTIDTLDLSAQHIFALDERNAVIWGLGYRLIGSRIEQTAPTLPVRNGDFTQQLFSAFIQDELKVIPDRLTVTVGTKLEHNDMTGFEIQPSVRAMLKPAPNQTLWAAVSRAVRTPNELEAKDVFALIVGPPFVGPGGSLYAPTLVGNASPLSQVLWAYELGYRIQPTPRVSVDLATFYNQYTRLTGLGPIARFIPGTPFGEAEIPWTNNQGGETYGGELAVTVAPTDKWRLTASYSLLRTNIQGPGAIPNSDPEHQAMLRSNYTFLENKADLDTQLRYVSQYNGVPTYLTADIRLTYRLTSRLEISLVGQNLFEARHLEVSAAPLQTIAEIPRGFYAKLTWRY